MTDEQAYQDFLAQIKANPSGAHIPSPAADRAWHRHILDTKNYQQFCQEFFGTFLHHDPATGTGYCAATLEK